MTTLARIVKPGLQTTIQDGGRPHQRHLGVSLSGAADSYSLALANAAVGNVTNAAGFECTLSGPELRFESDSAFALAGADMSASLNGNPVHAFQLHETKAGDVLSLATAEPGARAYIAFRGGLSGKEFLGSVSTYLPAALGGIDGRALRAGDEITGAGLETSSPREIPASLRPMLAHDFVLRATKGPEAHLMDEGDIERFFKTALTAGQRADRMGVRLTGYELTAPSNAKMNSSTVFPGTVQCPPDGAPFLLLADAQTTGGYPRIAQVIAADIPLTGQIRPGDRVWFLKTKADDARKITHSKQALIAATLPGYSYY